MLIRRKGLNKTQIKSANDIFKILMEVLKRRCKTDKKKEHFFVFGLTMSNRILYLELVSLGSLKQTVVGISEVFRTAILNHAAHLIVAHNHPSGNTKPSQSDKKITQKLLEAGKLLDIPITDHVIVTTEWYFSFAEEEELI